MHVESKLKATNGVKLFRVKLCSQTMILCAGQEQPCLFYTPCFSFNKHINRSGEMLPSYLRDQLLRDLQNIL